MPRTKFFSFFVLFLFCTPALAQVDHALAPAKMMMMIPDKIKGFNRFEDPKARKITLGTITYTLCEKKFTTRKKTLKIILFDYKEAPIMYRQAMKDWSGRPIIQTDSLISRSFVLPNCSGWESYNEHNGQSQIFLGICDRFYLMITGDKIELEVLKSVLQEIRVQDFPK